MKPYLVNNHFKSHWRIAVASGIVIVTVLFGGYVVWKKIMTDPKVAFLFSLSDADWIRLQEPFRLSARNPEERIHMFRIRFFVDKVPDNAILSFRVMKRAAVILDGRLLNLTDTNLDQWKKTYHLNLALELRPGEHELIIKVFNKNGHPALLAYNRELQLSTGDQWEASNNGADWLPAVPVDKIFPPLISQSFMRADQVFFSKSWFYVPIFFTIFICSFLVTKQSGAELRVHFFPTPQMVRWGILMLWVALAANNIGKIPLYTGMDIIGHNTYIRYVAEKWRIPMAGEGWQMFQAPLFYVFSAPVYNWSIRFFEPEIVAKILRIIPLCCGATQIELSYRMMRSAYPQRNDLQILGTIIGGLMPMNLYISQVIGNEPLAGLFSGMVVFLCFRLFLTSASQKKETFMLIGLFLGLAVLTKTTAMLLFPSIVFFVAGAAGFNSKPIYSIIISKIKDISFMMGVVFLVAGWYYIQNFVEMGRFFIGGWDAERGIVWWQDPGYRTLKQFFSFGESLFYPIYAGAIGIWDSLYSTLWLDGFLSGIVFYDYRPPWNYEFMISMTWLSLLPTAAIILGIVKTITISSKRLRFGLIYIVSCIFVYIGAILYLYLTVPIYSTGKATYMLGLLPGLAVLCVEGLEMLTRWSVLRAAVYGMIGCWAVSSYLAFFVC